MNEKKIDIVLINPGYVKQLYQGLAIDLAAIEPPFWIAVIASYLRNSGLSVKIIDANVEDISLEEMSRTINELNPLLTTLIVYGSHPSASTQNMTIARNICNTLKKNITSKIALGGLHPSALPERTIVEENVDFVIEGEGPITLEKLLNNLKTKKYDFSDVPGLWYRENKTIKNNPRPPLINDLDKVLPVAAWDLLPMSKYRAHNWHCFDDIENRMPYGAIYTSLGCPYSCVFCCINALFGKHGIRYRSPELVVEEIGLLVTKYGVKNIKIVDELFVLNEKHYMGIVDLIIKKGYNLNIWVYARVDSIKTENLPKMKKAGINWIGLGIESASTIIRDGAKKHMEKKDIVEIVKIIQSNEIRVGANYIFGLPDDTMETMQETLDLAMELNTEWANFNCAMAFPGSKLYDIAVSEGWELPKNWDGFSYYSYESLPLRTKYIGSREVLKFRDDAFIKYFENPKYLNMIEKKFGITVKEHVQKMTKTNLKRRILND
ncbi:MAG TPA: B12-binding domain-containing radical SAM protein [Elusimicrobia bacterium]|nr:MAG: B12-binding domain-containing radical SAM protein [Elusimicrobia bacterium RIFOXYD2_FULL_34_30]HAM38788.1 B12-binding domain-containing radical SAM protein [Elusimicrobiota bacterium]